MNKSYRSTKAKIENDINRIKQEIEVSEYNLKNTWKVSEYRYIDVSSLDNASIAKLLLENPEGNLVVVDEVVQFTYLVDETDEQFEQRKSSVSAYIASLKKYLEDKQNELSDLNAERTKELEMYKNPEYIEYLRLQKKFNQNG